MSQHDPGKCNLSVQNCAPCSAIENGFEPISGEAFGLTSADTNTDGLLGWQVLVVREQRRIYRVIVGREALDAAHGPHDVSAVAEAVKTRATELVAAGEAVMVQREAESLFVRSWEPEGSNAARDALEMWSAPAF